MLSSYMGRRFVADRGGSNPQPRELSPKILNAAMTTAKKAIGSTLPVFRLLDHGGDLGLRSLEV